MRRLADDLLADRAEAGLVAVADDDERRHREPGERRQLRPVDRRLLVSRLQLERTPLLGADEVVVLGSDPEVEVELRRAVEIARLEQLRLPAPVGLQLV